MGLIARWQLCIVLIGLAAECLAEEPGYRIVTINAESEYPSCAVFDVNRDGKLDIFCGGWWYELPDFKRHFVREVEYIRGRYDDYSNLPLDVDGDGWTDVVSCNYRSESLYWVRNPGASDQPWERIVIEQPGPMETGRLVDVNGDGKLDVLPNGAEFAAWWELDPASPGKWIRHDLPAQLAGHGIGWGDISGDGKLDLVSASGWCESLGPDQWQMHPEFRLHRDASIPILVHDFDQDGDQDLAWGRGHNVGLYWLEQLQKDGQRHWQQHTIDTSWSQAHSLLLADVDGDGSDEVIAGKRHLGHDGKDIGEYDPLQISYYRFDSRLRSWHRGDISYAGRAAFGVDPRAADVDGDGDVDFIAADRSGLYLCDNTGPAERRHNVLGAPKVSPFAGANHRMLVLRDNIGNEWKIETADRWGNQRAWILSYMQTVMGSVPSSSRRVPLDLQIDNETDAGKYTRKRVSFATEPGDRVPAYLLIPHQLHGPAPAMLCLHQTTNIGKDEPAGIGGLENLHYAHELAELGFVCIVPDYPSFGEYPFDFAAASDRYASGTMKAIWNNMRAIDLLESLPEVDPDRIGCIGHSLGGHNTLFTAAFDQRIRAAVTSCGFTAFHHYYDGDLSGWTSDRYMPRIRDRFKNDPNKVPFDFYEVLAAIAPRAVFVSAPLHDDNFDVEGVKKIEQEVAGVFQLLGAADRVDYIYPDSEHDFPDECREEAYRFLERQLK